MNNRNTSSLMRAICSYPYCQLFLTLLHLPLNVSQSSMERGRNADQIILWSQTFLSLPCPCLSLSSQEMRPGYPWRGVLNQKCVIKSLLQSHFPLFRQRRGKKEVGNTICAGRVVIWGGGVLGSPLQTPLGANYWQQLLLSRIWQLILCINIRVYFGYHYIQMLSSTLTQKRYMAAVASELHMVSHTCRKETDVPQFTVYQLLFHRHGSLINEFDVPVINEISLKRSTHKLSPTPPTCMCMCVA